MRNEVITIKNNQLNALILAIEIGNIKQCDGFLVKEPKLPILNHYFVYAGQNSDGMHCFFVTMSSIGRVKLLNENEIYELALKSNFEIVEHIPFKGNNIQREQAFQRGMSVIGKTYKWIGANCENLFNYIHTGKTKSMQTRLYGGAVGLIGFGMMKSKNTGVKILGTVFSTVGFGALLIDLISDFDKS